MLQLNKLVPVCVALGCCLGLVVLAEQQADVGEEMNQINKSLEGLLSELAVIKREATGRLSQTRSKQHSSSSPVDLDRIRRNKVSKFVLKRVAELELESLGMRDEMAKLFEMQKGSSNKQSELKPRSIESKQEDIDFEEAEPASVKPATTTAHAPSSSSTSAAATTTTTTTTTTQKTTDAEEAAQIGFDLEALKKLGNELESEIEARQAQRPESLRGVHEQVIKLIDNMVQNYLGNMRRAVQRFQNFVDSRRPTVAKAAILPQETSAGDRLGRAQIQQLDQLTRRLREFTFKWARVVGKQQSPLIDRIPPRGVELWRDFWDTVRKQVRRINQEFSQVARDMGRMLTGRNPATGSQPVPNLANLLYADVSKLEQEQRDQVREQFQEFYDKLTETLSKEQQRMELALKRGEDADANSSIGANELIDEQDDEATRNELDRNVALRQQIQQEINVFGSIFDIMRQFIQRLRESATHIRDVLTPPGASNNNDAVTPGPSVKPTVDQLLEETINSQRNINSQAKPVLMPSKRQPIN